MARPDPHWLDAIERETASWRLRSPRCGWETVSGCKPCSLHATIPLGLSDAEIALDGWMERLVRSIPRSKSRDRYRRTQGPRPPAPRCRQPSRSSMRPHIRDLTVTSAAQRGIAAGSLDRREDRRS